MHQAEVQRTDSTESFEPDTLEPESRAVKSSKPDAIGPFRPNAVEPFEPNVVEPFEPDTIEPFEPDTVGPFEPGAVEPFQPDTIELEPGASDEGNLQGTPICYVLELDLVSRLDDSSTQVTLANFIVNAPHGIPPYAERPEAEEGISVTWPISYVIAFIFGLYLPFILFVVYNSLYRMILS